MSGKFKRKYFSDINLNDRFFDSLKTDYPGSSTSTGFIDWFRKKSEEGKKALVFEDEQGIGAFICLKPEAETIQLTDFQLPNKNRLKISTIKIDDRYQQQRLGEGALGLTLWHWLASQSEEIYLTVFNKHSSLISLLEKFGFSCVGCNKNGEQVYLKSRKHIDFSNPYKAFPFLHKNIDCGRYLIVNDFYHDTMFPYSGLKNTLQEHIDLMVANGLTKIYISSATNGLPSIGNLLFIYRKHTGEGVKRYKSCLTSYCIVTNVIRAKINGKSYISFEELLQRIGNKSVYNINEIKEKYNQYLNMVIIEMIYFGYFGAGNNVNMDWLDENGCWSPKGAYPTTTVLSSSQINKILLEGKIDVNNIIID